MAIDQDKMNATLDAMGIQGPERERVKVLAEQARSDETRLKCVQISAAAEKFGGSQTFREYAESPEVVLMGYLFLELMADKMPLLELVDQLFVQWMKEFAAVTIVMWEDHGEGIQKRPQARDQGVADTDTAPAGAD